MAIGDMNLSLGGAEQQMDIVRQLEGWKSQNLQKVQEASTAIGEKEAKRDFKEQEGEFRQSFGISNKAYNKTLAAGYKASAKADLSEQLSAIAAEYPSDLQMYNDLAGEAVKSAIEGADPYIADDLALEADLVSSSYRKQVQGNSIKQGLKASRAEVANAINIKSKNALGTLSNATNDEEIAAAALQMADTIDLIDKQDHLNDTQKAIQKEGLAKGFAEQSFLNPIFNAETSEQAFLALEEMADTPTGWSPEEWQDVTNKGLAHANKLAMAENELLKLSTKQIEAQELQNRGSVLFENGIAIDPYKTTEGAKYDYKAINSYYETTYSEEINRLPVNEQLNANTAFVQRTGIIPEQLEERINAFARNGDITQAGIAADQLARIQEVSPQAIRDLKPEVKSVLLSVSDAMRAGSDVESALEAARKSAFHMTEAQKQEIAIASKEYSADLSSNLQTMLNRGPDEGGFDKWNTFGAPASPPAMEAEYKVLFDKYMVLQDGNAANAEKLAYEDLKNVWSVSDITGGFMKHAPEAVYAVPGVDSDWMKEQFDQETADYNNASIVVDAATARSKRPEYKLMHVDDRGITVPVYDENNMPLVWTPDYTQTEEFKEFQNQPSAVEKAKLQREKNKVSNLNQKVKMINARMYGIKRSMIERGGYDEGLALERSLKNALSLGEINENDLEQLRAHYANKN